MSISFDAPAVLGSNFNNFSMNDLYPIPHQQHVEVDLKINLDIPSEDLSTFVVDLHYETVEERDELGALGTTFRAWFCIGGRKYTFTGRFFQKVPHFNGCARIYYKTLTQLHGCQSFTGRLGPSAIYLRLCNGVVIAGKLHRRLYRSYRISGRGSWSCSK